MHKDTAYHLFYSSTYPIKDEINVERQPQGHRAKTGLLKWDSISRDKASDKR